MKRIALYAVAVLLAGGCTIIRHRPSDGVVRTAPPPPGHKATPGPGSDTIRVKEIKAGEVRARVIHAKEVKADRARIGRVIKIRNPAGDWGKGEIRTDRVQAEEIYAKEIHCNLLIADEVYVHELHIEGDDDGPGRGRGRGRDKDD